MFACRYLRRLTILWFFALAALPAKSQESQWPMTFYGGPSTDSYFTQIYGRFEFRPNGFMFGIAVDPRLYYLGWGISLEGEALFTEFTFGHNYQTFNLSPGLRYDGTAFGHSLSIAAYSGPSYATAPPRTGIGPGDTIDYFAAKHWLNYVGAEIAVGPNPTSRWQGVFRMFHRSGAFGLYTLNDDSGSSFGLGLRYLFGANQ